MKLLLSEKAKQPHAWEARAAVAGASLPLSSSAIHLNSSSVFRVKNKTKFQPAALKSGGQLFFAPFLKEFFVVVLLLFDGGAVVSLPFSYWRTVIMESLPKFVVKKPSAICRQ